jgi:glucosamine kinase
MAAGHVDALARGLNALGARRLALMGGLGGAIEPWLAEATRRHLVAPEGDALEGALRLAAGAAGLEPMEVRLRILEQP